MRKLLLLLLFFLPFTVHGQSWSGQSSGTARVVPPYKFCWGADNGKDVCIYQKSNNTIQVLNGDLLDKNGNPFGTGGGGGPSGPIDFTQITGTALCNQIPSLNGDASTPSGTCTTTVTKVQGNSFPSSAAAAHQIYIATSSGSFVLKTLPDCPDSAGNHLNYVVSTDLFSCGTTQNLTIKVNNNNTVSQNVINMKAGTNMTLTPDGSGGILFDAATNPGACSVPTLVNGDFFTNNGSTCSWAALANAPASVTDTPGTYISGYDQPSGNQSTRKLSLASPVFSTTDTLTDTVTTEQLFSTRMTIPANTIVTNVAYKFAVTLEWTSVATVPNYTFQIYLCPTAGSLTGCKDVYKSTTTAPSAGTFNTTMDFGFQGMAAAGASANVMMMSGAGVGANAPVGRNVLSPNVSGVPTNGTLYLQFSIIYNSAAGAGANTLSVRALTALAGPLT